jgi:hypothetical protein
VTCVYVEKVYAQLKRGGDKEKTQRGETREMKKVMSFEC